MADKTILKYHPDTRFLTDYAAGTLPESQALCVATHLHYCRACQQKVSELNTLGDVIFSSQQPMPVSTSAFDSLMVRIEEGKTGDSHQSIRVDNSAEMTKAAGSLPPLVTNLAKGSLDNLNWRNIGKKFRYTRLNSNKDQRETSLFFIGAGGSVPHHQHLGDEITVVLQGSFSDQEDQYHVGDFIVRCCGEKHQPVASQNEDCLCLSTLDAPIRMSNPLLRMLMPLVGSTAG